MDRLTKRNSDGSVGINDFRYYNYDDFQKLAQQLAHYEDLFDQGRLVEQKHGRWIAVHKSEAGKILWNCTSCMRAATHTPTHYCPNCGAKMDAEVKDGVTVPPCKVGDTVYQTDEARIRIYESTIKRIIYDTDGIAFDERAIGKNVFLTRAEAEAKLAEKGGAE